MPIPSYQQAHPNTQPNDLDDDRLHAVYNAYPLEATDANINIPVESMQHTHYAHHQQPAVTVLPSNTQVVRIADHNHNHHHHQTDNMNMNMNNTNNINGPNHRNHNHMHNHNHTHNNNGVQFPRAMPYEEQQHSIAAASPPSIVSDLLSNIRSHRTLFHRTQLVEQLVDMLQEVPAILAARRTPNNYRVSGTVLRGMGGIGKTVTCAIAISKPEVLQAYPDGVAWLEVGHCEARIELAFTGMSLCLKDYRAMLSLLCAQLGIDPAPVFPQSIPEYRLGDDVSKKAQKEIQCMIAAKQIMTRALCGKKVLIVLDDVWHWNDAPWFDFWCENFLQTPRSISHLLVTSRMRNVCTHRREPLDIGVVTHHDIGVLNVEEEDVLYSNNFGDVYNCVYRPDLMSHGFVNHDAETDMNLVDMREWSVKESVDLFLDEARLQGRFNANTDDSYSTYLEDIVKTCGCIPVAIRAAGRLALSITEDKDQGLNQLYDIKAFARNLRDHMYKNDDSGDMLRSDETGNHMVFSLFESSIHRYRGGSVDSKLLFTCFAAFCAVFKRVDTNRPWVPMKVLCLFLKQICINQFGIHDERMCFRVINALEVLGFVDLKDQVGFEDMDNESYSYRIHHDMMQQYGEIVAKDLFAKRFIPWKFYLTQTVLRLTLSNANNNLEQIFHGQLVRAYYLTSGEINWVSAGVSSRPSDQYFLRYLPSHMIKAGMIAEVEAMYEDYNFFETQVKVLGGPVECVEQFLLDVRLTTKLGLVKKCAIMQSFRVVIVNLLTIASEIGDNWDDLKLVVRAFFVLGEALQFQSHWDEAVDVFMHASSICTAARRPDNDLDMAKVNRLLSNNVIVNLSLVHKNSPRRLRLKYKNELLSSHISGFDGVPLELESHDGKAICLSPGQDGGTVQITFYVFCFGPAESAVLAKNVDEMIQVVNKNGTNRGYLCHFPRVLCTNRNERMPEMPMEGMQLLMCDSTVASKFNLDFRAPYIVDKEDGCISPKAAPDLVIGVGMMPFSFVARDSPCRLIFENLLRKDSRTCGDDSFGLKPLGRVISHPGKSITCAASVFIVGIEISHFGIGSEEEIGEGITLYLRNNDQLSLSMGLGLFYVATPEVTAGIQLLAILHYDSKNRSFIGWAIEYFGFYAVKVNEDGSISPKNAPHLALGTSCLGNANNLISPELMKQAAAESCPSKLSLIARIQHKFFAWLILLIPLLVRLKICQPTKPKST